MTTFITFSYLSDSKRKTFLNIFISRFKMEDLMLWMLLKKLFSSIEINAQRKRLYYRFYFRSTVTYRANRILKWFRNLHWFNWLNSRLLLRVLYLLGHVYWKKHAYCLFINLMVRALNLPEVPDIFIYTSSLFHTLIRYG